MSIQEVRAQFPILSGSVYGKPLVYLDNAATSQRPLSVIDKYESLLFESNANIHRAVHALAARATEEYESTRDYVCEFLNAGSREEIVFTSGTTASINLVAFSFGESFVQEGDEVIVTVADHHSNIVPWQMMCSRKKAVLKALEISKNGVLSVDALRKLISRRTKIVAIPHISNVLGLVNPVREIAAFCHENAIPVLVDGAQGVVHEKIDVRGMDCDFYAFSGHKVFAATGTGVLYGKKRWLDAMVPFMGGGEMIETVRFSGTTYAPLPQKFEAGTQNFNAVPTLKPALEFHLGCIEDPPLQEELRRRDEFILESLLRDSRIRLFGVPRGTERKVPVYSFMVEGAHHEDLALILDKMGIAVRSGKMCAEPLMDHLGVTGMVRASFGPYNGMEDAEAFLASLDRAIKMLV